MSKRSHTEACAEETPFGDLKDLANLEYKQPTVRGTGAKMVFVTRVPGSVDPEDRISMQLSRSADRCDLQTLVWDVSKPIDDQNASRRSLELAVEDPGLVAYLKALDERNLDEAELNSESWFKKKFDRAALSNNYQHIFREREREDFRDSIRIKVATDEAPHPTLIQVVTSQSDDGDIVVRPGGLEDLVKNSRAMVLASTAGIWISRYNFGMSFLANQIIVWPSRRAGAQALNLGKGRAIVVQTD